MSGNRGITSILNDEYAKIVMSYLSWHCSDLALILSTGITTILEKHLPAQQRKGSQRKHSTELTTNTRPTDATTGTTTTPTSNDKTYY